MPSDVRSSALEKALSVLEAVSDQPQAVGLPDLAARLELPRQTVHRLLGQLEKPKLVVRDPSRERYSVGPRLSRLAFVTLRSLNQSAPVRLILQDLVDDIGETCNVGVLDDLDYVFLQLIECRLAAAPAQEVGTRMRCAHRLRRQGAARLSRPVLSRNLIEGPQAEGRHIAHPDAPRRPRGRIRRIRAAGYALNNQERIDGVVGVAVPVFDPDGNVLASVGMHGPLPRVSMKTCERHVPRLRQAAARIARVWFA